MEKNNDLTEIQKKHREQMKENREKIKQRKVRTHRLIVRGAIAEKLVPNAESMTDEEFGQYLYRALSPVKGVSNEPSRPQEPLGREPEKKLKRIYGAETVQIDYSGISPRQSALSRL